MLVNVRMVTAIFAALSIVTPSKAGDDFRELVITSTVTTRIVAWGRYSRFRCDSDGNIYLRVYNEDLKSPVIRVSADGQKVTQFVIPVDEGLSGIQDFWATGDSELYVLA